MKTIPGMGTRLPAVLLGIVFTLLRAGSARAQELEQVFDAPLTGTFYLLSLQLDGNESPPFPFDPYEGVLPVYHMDGFPGVYVVADSPEDYLAYKTLAADSYSSESLLMEGLGGGEVYGALSLGPPAFLTSTQLCLLPPVLIAPDMFLVAVTNAQEGHVYELQGAEFLNGAGWSTERAMFVSTNQNWAAVSVGSGGRAMLFLRARDWTDVDEDQDTLPDWWEWEYLGTLGYTAQDDPDGDGVNNGDELLAGTDPGDPDADGDGMLNLAERLGGTDPFEAAPFELWLGVPRIFSALP